MAFEPDIVVTGNEPSEVALVVQVKTSTRSIDDAERQLKRYMAAVGSPVGLIVTPEVLRIYHDQYLPPPDESVVTIGEFDARGLFKFGRGSNPAADPQAFERQVQSWLENLSTESGIRELAPELRRSAQIYLVPALVQGSVRSGHPRSPLTV